MRDLRTAIAIGAAAGVCFASDLSAEEATLYHRIAIPEALLASDEGHSFGGDLRLGDLDGDGEADLLLYRSDDSGDTPGSQGGFKPSFLGAFNLAGEVLWSVGRRGGGTHPVRPGSVAVHDLDGDGAAEVIHFWHRPAEKGPAGWDSLADVMVQVRDGRTGEVLREAAPPEITGRTCPDRSPNGKKLSGGRRTANWVHQRLLVANLRGTDHPRDFVVKLGDTHVAFSDHLEVLWTHRSPWVEYGECPAYIPAVGDIDGDGRDEVNSGYFLLDEDGSVLWESKLGRNMDSVDVAVWDQGKVRAICSGYGHVVAADGRVILSLGEEAVPHGQEVRVADFMSAHPGPEMALRHRGHTPELILVGSAEGKVLSRLRLNPSPNDTGMESVWWHGRGAPALLTNGGWLWNLEKGAGFPLPALPPAHGAEVHRMGFYHAIPADLRGDAREELLLWDPTAAEVFVYGPPPAEREQPYGGYRAGPRQYNARLMD